MRIFIMPDLKHDRINVYTDNKDIDIILFNCCKPEYVIKDYLDRESLYGSLKKIEPIVNEKAVSYYYEQKKKFDKEV